MAPDLVSERQILLAEYESASATRDQLNVSARLRVASEVVQRATLPSEPEPTPANRLLIAGIMGGGFAGLLAAVVLARLSPRVLDEAHAMEILGQPMVGSFPKSRVLAKDRRSSIEKLPSNVAPFVNSVCVRAEAQAQNRESLTVVVVGSQRWAGATTLAGAVANRFAATGATVLLVDGDQRDPELTALFIDHGRSLGPLQRQESDSTSSTHEGDRQDSHRWLDRSSATALANLEIATVGGDLAAGTLRRQHVVEVVEEATGRADIIVFDGGPLMAASSTVELARLCDAVIVAMPRRQFVRPLRLIAGELRDRSFLPVWTPARGRRSRFALLGRRSVRPEHHDVSAEPVGVDEPVETDNARPERSRLGRRGRRKASNPEASTRQEPVADRSLADRR